MYHLSFTLSFCLLFWGCLRRIKSGHSKTLRPFDNFLAESIAGIHHFRICPQMAVKVGQLSSFGLNGFGDGHSSVNKVDDPFEVGLLEASGSQGMRPQTDAPRHQGTFVARHRVLVQGDVDLVAHIFNASTVDTLEKEPLNLLCTLHCSITVKHNCGILYGVFELY